MLDVMTGMSVTWRELATVWPWSRVTRAHEAVTNNRYLAAWPVAQLTRFYLSANSKPNARIPQPVDLLQPGQIPLSIIRERARKQAEKAIYSEAVVKAFSLAQRLGFTGNAHLSAFGVDELRASGWGRNNAA